MNRTLISALSFVMSLVFLVGCGGGGGGDGGSGSATTSTGTISLDIADAKPFIDGAEQPAELWVIFDEVLVHTSGGGWVSLDLPRTPFEINLLAFYDGRTTEFATPTRIPAGHVTQIRFEIRRAYMVFPDSTTEEIDLDVPSGTLRTDKQIDWTLTNGGAMSLTVHFDLSQSIVRSGPVNNPKYHLKPVVHLFNNDPDEAATICGKISAGSFVDVDPPEVPKVDVSVDWKESEGSQPQPYTHVTVLKESDTDATDFCIYWLVPLEEGESYAVLIDNGFARYDEIVSYAELASGVTPFELNSGVTISISSPPM